MSQHLRKGIIGVLTPYIGGHYYGALLYSIQQELQSSNLKPLIVVNETDNIVTTGTAHPSLFAQNMVDGWIVIERINNIDVIEGVPLVTISTVMPGFPAVLPDNRNGVSQTVRHLIQLGHQRIAFIGNFEAFDVQQRYESYRTSLEQAHMLIDERMVIDVDTMDIDGGYQGVQALLNIGLPCTAIVAGTDRNAMGVIRALQEAGHHVPRDTAVVGFDNEFRAQINDPPLTTVQPHFGLLGKTATRLLLSQIQGDLVSLEPVSIPGELVIRYSCGNTQNWLEATLPTVTAQQDVETQRKTLIDAIYTHLALTPSSVSVDVQNAIATLSEVVVPHSNELSSPIDIELMTHAWKEIVRFVNDIHILDNLYNILEQFSTHQHEQAVGLSSNNGENPSILPFLRQELVRSQIAQLTEQNIRIQTMMLAEHQLNTSMLRDTPFREVSLEWTRHIGVYWACFAIWSDQAYASPLQVMMTHYQDELPTTLEQQYVTADFPPETLLSREHPTVGVPLLLPVYTAQQDWGVLVLSLSGDLYLLATTDFPIQWSHMLGAVLERAKLAEELSERQYVLEEAYQRERELSTTVRELGSLVIPLLPRVLFVPLIGVIDDQRAQHLLTQILQAVGDKHATKVLIDVTGVQMIDTYVATVLMQINQSVQLMGAQVIMVGIRPEIAQSLVDLGLRFDRIKTFASLESAIVALQ